MEDFELSIRFVFKYNTVFKTSFMNHAVNIILCWKVLYMTFEVFLTRQENVHLRWVDNSIAETFVTH